MTTNLLNYDAKGLADFCTEIGEKPFRAKQLLRWIHQSGITDFVDMSDLAKGLREKLAVLAVIESPQIISDYVAADGTRKWLLSVGAGNGIETVFIPEANRGTLCVSSQVGCALACTFCSTGKQGFNRNLTVAEIIGQLWIANKTLKADPNDTLTDNDRVVSNVVMMGMGEPLANFDHVVAAMRLMLDDHAYGLSRRRVTLSTAGLVPALDRLRQECPVALAVSLHAPNDTLRDELVPINRKYPLRELLGACERYLTQAPRDFITFEYVLLDGINDTQAHAKQLSALVKQIPCKFNLIPFNPFPQAGYHRSSPENVRRFRDVLTNAGYIVTTRKTRGDDIDAACGQLAGKVQDKTSRQLRYVDLSNGLDPSTT